MNSYFAGNEVLLHDVYARIDNFFVISKFYTIKMKANHHSKEFPVIEGNHYTMRPLFKVCVSPVG